jgi:hypothetical protein
MSIYNCPIEILENILKYCNNKEYLNLGKVNYSFYQITKNKNTEIRKTLRKYIRDKDYGLFTYIIENDWFNFELLLKLGVFNPNYNIYLEVEKEYKSVLEVCIKYKRIYMIHLLIKYGVDVNVYNKEGITPLMCAVSEDGDMVNTYSYEIVVMLLKAGADPNLYNRYGYIAMDMISMGYGDFGISTVRELLRDHGSMEGTVIYDVYDFYSVNY